MNNLFDKIDSPDDIKNLSFNELEELAKEIRRFTVRSVSKTGGHLASNLGVVELTLALHYCFNAPEDKILWDVGHQSYIHKMLTGRKNKFNKLRKFEGLSGFPRPDESNYDAFISGHSSGSVSAALGMATARDLNGLNNSVIAVIGDGSMTGGEAYEALNNAGRANTDLLVILNDNQMSISKNVGALAKHLNDMRTAPSYIKAKESVHGLLEKLPVAGKGLEKIIEKVKDGIKYFLVSGIIFEEMGFNYIGPIDGHNIEELVSVLNKVKRMKGPVLLHVYTKKGKGYKYSEMDPCIFHSTGAFDIKTGKSLSDRSRKSFTDCFGDAMIKLGQKNDKVLAVSAAMIDGTGLSEFSNAFPKRIFDVAIAEQHAVTFSAGLAKSGFIPVFAVYSTFLQRAYDQIIHDVCLQNLHMIFAIDRAGVVGPDGETHQGVFDIAFLYPIPNITIMAPKNGRELEEMLMFAAEMNGPVAIRYPKEKTEYDYEETKEIEYGKAEIIEEGKDIAIIFAGCMYKTAAEVCRGLKEKGYQPTLINARFLKPFDKETIIRLKNYHKYIFTIEDGVKTGGFGEAVSEYCMEARTGIKTVCFALPDIFIEQGSRPEIFKKYMLDTESILNKCISVIEEDKK